MVCSNSPTFAVGTSTDVLCSEDQSRAVGLQYCMESLSPATLKTSLGRSRDKTTWYLEAAAKFLHGPAARQKEAPFSVLLMLLWSFTFTFLMVRVAAVHVQQITCKS